MLSKKRLQDEIKDVLKEIDIEQLKARSDSLLHLANSLEAKDLPAIVGALSGALTAGCQSQDVEALLRLCDSDFWIGAPNSKFNFAMRFSFDEMANGIYRNPNSYRENFEKIAVAQMTMLAM
jgi:hypothetical protein